MQLKKVPKMIKNVAEHINTWRECLGVGHLGHCNIFSTPLGSLQLYFDIGP